MDPLNLADPINFAEYMKEQGNEDFKNGNYALAIKKYDEALGALLFVFQTQRISHPRDMAVLLCNRSNAFYNLNKWREAFGSAQECLQWDPAYVKGYYRAGYSLIRLSKTLEAVGMFYQDEQIIPSQFSWVCKSILSENFRPTVWQLVVEKLANQGLWQSCLLLATEKDNLPRSLHVTNVSLKDLFEKYVFSGQYERMERLPKLVEWLVSIGASLESIGAYPLHAVVQLCIKAKSNHLFKWLLAHKPELKNLINQQNEDGSTLLHVVASHSQSLRDDVVMLLDAGVDPRILDAQLRTAMDIFKKNKKFREIDVINKHIARCMSFSEAKSVAGQTESKASEDNASLLRHAFKQFADFCCLENSSHGSLLEHKEVRWLLQRLSTVTEIPEDIACDIAPTFASNFIKLLLEKQRWHEVLLLLTWKVAGEMTSRDGFVTNCNLSGCDIGTILKHMDRADLRREQLVRCLIERGASPEGTGTLCEKPLQKCLKNNDFEMAYLLLSSGADSHCLSIVEGDTPLHAALFVCFNQKGDIGLRFLSFLLDLYDSNPSAFPHLHPNSQDKDGNTVMHIIFQKGLTKQVKKMIHLLAKFDVNFNLKNKYGRDVRHRKKKNDPVLIAWNEAVIENKKKYRHDTLGRAAKVPKPTPTCSESQAKRTAPSSSESPSNGPPGKSGKESKVGNESHKEEEAENAGVTDTSLTERHNPLTVHERLTQEITQLIKKLPLLSEGSTKMNSVASQVLKPSLSVAKNEDEKHEHPQTCGHEAYSGRAYTHHNKGDAVDAHNELTKSKEEEEEDTKDTEQFQEIESCMQDFDNMTWEIECTSEMLKKLGSKAIPNYMRKKIIFAIQQLGNGEWTQSLQKRLKRLKAGIQLYEAKLDKGARMLWELAIDFSPRCSENAEKIIESEHSTHPMEKSGRVYTEIIRVWDIVLDHCKLDRAIDTICVAYNRGLSCILRKKLKGINAALISSNLKTQKRIPRFYVEDSKAEKSGDCVIPEYFPPASAVETEYNIMKFHSFTTNMAHNVLNDMTSAVEYPFRVGELEYAIIDLNPKPMEPIILIGRSGTGKTTCCLYRLWKKFHSYWEKAESAGGPLLVRQKRHRLKFEMLGTESTEEEGHIGKQDNNDSVGSDEPETSESTDDDEECGSSSTGNPELNPAYDGETEEKTTEDFDRLEHLHQIFVTKNHVLCQEVQRNFVELSKSSKATSHFKPLEANIYRLQDVKDENFPLFLTSKHFLLLLDASLPEPFFQRNEDGSLKRNIAGWSTKEELIISNWQEEDDNIDGEIDYDEDEKAEEQHAKENDPRVFVTYGMFATEIWSQMIKGTKCSYNPALVWKEIKSFLKGSFEAQSSPQGILTEDEYKQLGRKRSPNFKEDRSEIYQLFCVYQQIKSRRGYFDEEDILYNLSQRLLKLRDLPWCIHELYGDEIQDFTQAELALLMKCTDDPNAMFLTGDTAQSIMKGVAFRFSDLRSLFHYASKNSTDKKQFIVRKPRRIYQLYQNYRSHSGILHLASGVVDLLQCYFPESFDRLPRDSGLFDGPRPTVLDSCSISDLAILLRGNKRKTQPIEFGAHQVILVANEMVKEKIPEELSLALVLTIYEAKGLEFDDVLLYNFFTDSEAYKEWKIISSFTAPSWSPEESKIVLEAPLEKEADTQGKPPFFNAEMYKMLNGELKQLYTAITRARVNLWIFDENCDKRAAAFQYFMKRELVQVVKTDENKDFDNSMFVKTSTPEEWIAQGDYYAKHHCWKVAAKCYQKGGAIEKEKLMLAHVTVLEVQTKKSSPKEKQIEYMDLAKTYLECVESNLALVCLLFAKEYQLYAQLCEKLGKVRKAAYFYKRCRCYKDAYRCFEQIQEFDLALKMCCHEELYEEAAKAVERYETIIRQERQPALKLSYTANNFYLEAAAKYGQANKVREMMAVLSHVNIEGQLVFLKGHKYFSEAADLLKEQGRDEEAAKLMKENGFMIKAAELTNQKDFRASCLLAEARRLSRASDHNLENLRTILEEVLELCKQTNQKLGCAEATYWMGVLKGDFSTLKEAFVMFLHVNHNAAAVEALSEAICCEETSESILKLVTRGIEVLLNLAKAFQKAGTNAEREMVKSCFDYFGVVQVDSKTCQVFQNDACGTLEFSSEDSNQREKKTSHKFTESLEAVKSALNKHFLKRLFAITQRVLQMSFPSICLKFIAGLTCEDDACEDFHETLSLHKIKSVLQCKMHLTAINGLLLEAKRVFSKEMFYEPNPVDEMLTADKYALCKSLIHTIFPKHFHLRIVSENSVACKQNLSLNSRIFNVCKMVLREYVISEFKNTTAQNRRESTDLWLKAMQVFALTSSYPEEFERILFKEEDEYSRELKLLGERGRGQTKFIEGRYGMLLPDKYAENAESNYLCFIGLLQGSLDRLYVHRNLEECKWLFYRFMNVLVKKCVNPLIPSIGNTVALLEFQFNLCCGVLMRLCKNMTLCLPKSYIALFHYWDFLFVRGNHYKDFTFSVIQEYRPEDTQQAVKQFRVHLMYLADVLCKYENFNVLLDAFSDLDFITSGEAERTVVLCLVMWVNADQVLSYRYKKILAKHFPTIKENLVEMKKEYPSKVPERLLKIVALMCATSDIKVVVEGLKELLLCRDMEYLADCRWRWDSKVQRGYEDTKVLRGIFYRITDLERFTRLNQAEYFEEPEMHLDKDLYVAERKDPLADIASTKQQKQQQKAAAKRKLRSFFLFVHCCIRWKWISSSKPESLEMTSGIFKKADTDQTQCDLCGVKFLRSSESVVIPAEDFEKVDTTTEGKWEESVERNDSFVASETFETHIILNEHKNKRASYQKYFEFFKNTVDPVIYEGRDVMESFEENISIGSHFASREQSKLMQGKIQEGIKKISDAVEDVYKRKEWADAQEAMSTLARNLKSNLEEAREWLKKESNLLKEEELNHDKDLDEEVKGTEAYLEKLHPKKCSRKNARNRKK